MSRNDIFSHCILNGSLRGYKNWIYHGESYIPLNEPQDEDHLIEIEARDEMVDMVQEAMGIGYSRQNNDNPIHPPMFENLSGANEVTQTFFKLLEDAKCELYVGCENFTKLSFVFWFLVLNVTNG